LSAVMSIIALEVNSDSSQNQKASAVGAVTSGNVPAVDDSNYFEQSRILARVGGQPIFVGDILYMVNSIIESKAAEAPEEVKIDARRKLMSQALPGVIEQKMVFVDMLNRLPDKAKIPEFRKSVFDQFDKNRLPDLMKEYKVETRDELDAKLRMLGTSLRQQRENWTDQQMVGMYVQQFVKKDEPVTREEMFNYYLDHKPEYAFPAKAKFEELMIRFDKCASRDEAWEKIAEMGNEVVLGASLAAVAKVKSHGFRAQDGGMFDWTTKGSLRAKEIDAALFSIELNKLSDIIETQDGFHIIRVLDRQDAGFVTFQSVQPAIKEKLEQMRKTEALDKYLKELREKIPVETFE
jgi:parvulin-like peptidyl-prolyl isomerase